PYPCQGSFVLDGGISGAVPATVSASELPEPEDPETAFLEGVVLSAAAAASSSGRVAPFNPLGDDRPNSVQIAATYCGSAHAIAVDDDIPVQLRLKLIDRIGKWTRRGSFR
ncbi:MAG: hypothetical protein KC561_15750, partial [Myxococcales bacterium]|nr:hypothetical protein [Myxococcales bacterium]